MQWPARMVGSGRISAERAYPRSRLYAPSVDPFQPSHWWVLCSLLSRHQMRHGLLRPMPDVWSELLPFLLIEDDRLAERAMCEYLLYLEDPRLADKQWLGLQINGALECLDTWNEGIAGVLDQPASAFAAPWMALLGYAALLRVRRAVTLYGSDAAHTRRRSYWHGMPVFDEIDPRTPRGRTALRYSRTEDVRIRRRLRCGEAPGLATYRRFLPVAPASLS